MGLTKLEKEILRLLEIYRISGKHVDIDVLSLEIPVDYAYLESVVDKLVDLGLVNDRLLPTGDARKYLKVGLIGGVFDILHPGHIATLEAAKKMVDVLSVVVARDRTVFLNKKRLPLNNEAFRLKMVSSLKPVDVAILGSIEDFMEPVRRVKPDIIFLGYDQSLPKQVSKELNDGGISIVKLNVEVPGIKSSKLLKKVLDLLGY